MKLRNKSSLSGILTDLSQLNDSELLSGTPQALELLQRLKHNRSEIQGALRETIDALMQISSLDLMIHHDVETLIKVTSGVSDATRSLYHASDETSDVASAVSGQHEELTSTIISASEESTNVYQKIENGQNELTQIKELSLDTIATSEEMKNDMDQLSDVIGRMNEVIEGINAISSQTNLLSLNASIEAARAGEAGRGFAVVADEIRNLANETQELTQNMGEFVQGVKEASNKSVTSASNTIAALESMTEKIGNVWKINEENQQHMALITDKISSLASVSEEISSSMAELESEATAIHEDCQTLDVSIEHLQGLSSALSDSIAPLERIESLMDNTASIIGDLSKDSLLSIAPSEFKEYIENAITAHENWLVKLERIVNEQTILPLQLDDHKCGFGHFYYAVTPQYPQVQNIWKELGPKHKKFHNYGSQIIDALFSENYNEANRLYSEAKDFSLELIHDLNAIKEAL